MSKKEMKVVRNLVTERYMGRWYEIALFPSFFQPKNGKDTRTTYNLNSDGSTVHVLNETWSDGKRDSIEGTAYKANPKSDEAKLKVKFYLPPFLPLILVTGNYWVLYVDPDYQVVNARSGMGETNSLLRLVEEKIRLKSELEENQKKRKRTRSNLMKSRNN
ncbi:hypothetical protein ACS0TY_030185 [Phlomoides rotata]